MGLSSIPWIGQKSAENILSQDNLEAFLLKENIELNSDIFPYKHVSDFRKIYQDDLLLRTLKIHGFNLHYLVLKWALFCVTVSGVI